MRVSAKADDPGNMAFVDALCAGKTVHIFLDEIEQRSVITADEAQGFVERHVLDADGNSQVNPFKTDEVWVETVTGKVRIETR